MPFYAGYSYTLSSDRSFLGLLGLSGLWWNADKPCKQCFIQPGRTIPSNQILIFLDHRKPTWKKIFCHLCYVIAEREFEPITASYIGRCYDRGRKSKSLSHDKK